MRDELWHQLPGTTEPLITAPRVTCQLEILHPGLACFEANSSSKNPSWIMTLAQCVMESIVERELQKKQSQARASARPINNRVCKELG